LYRQQQNTLLKTTLPKTQNSHFLCGGMVIPKRKSKSLRFMTRCKGKEKISRTDSYAKQQVFVTQNHPLQTTSVVFFFLSG